MTIEARLLAPVNTGTPITLLQASVVGPGTSSEVQGTDDKIQIQFPMQVTGGELFDGALTGFTLSSFIVTYSFDQSIGGVEYHLVIKGNTVVLIDPPGRYNPLYQRDHYRENNTRWVKADRFASESEFDW